ncbi:MAG: hypothetical protein IPI67_08880 [Myxococcales bacterium]|nr:hypothetical protein [Myxococcales bacterium]
MHQPIRVALVGRRLEHNENLGLSYLVAALRRARIDVERHYVNDAAELKQVLMGLSFPCLASFEVCAEHVIIE